MVLQCLLKVLGVWGDCRGSLEGLSEGLSKGPQPPGSLGIICAQATLDVLRCWKRSCLAVPTRSRSRPLT